MKDFEQYINKFAHEVLRGKLDLAVLYDKFVAGGLYVPKTPETSKKTQEKS